MANYTHNRLQVCGSRDALARFRKEIAGTDDDGHFVALDFERVAPTPAETNGAKWNETDEGRELLCRLPSLDAVDSCEAYILLARNRGLDEHLSYRENDAVYLWRLQHWGSCERPEHDDCSLELGEYGELVYLFPTRQYDASALVAELGRQHPDLTFKLAYYAHDRVGVAFFAQGAEMGSWEEYELKKWPAFLWRFGWKEESAEFEAMLAEEEPAEEGPSAS